MGRALVPALLKTVRAVRTATRHPVPPVPGLESVAIGDMSRSIDWGPAVVGATSVVHLAARVHVMQDGAADPLAEFRAVNRDATLALARAAAGAGVRRFVFVSTIKVLGEATFGRALTEADPARLQDPYSTSKWEAEQGLRQIEATTGMQVVVVRPALVYGPGAGGNLRRLMRLITSGIPLPFGSLTNRRAMVGVGNLADLLVHCIQVEGAAGEIFLAADNEAISTPELVTQLARGLNRSVRLLPCPASILRALGALSGRRAEVDRLIGSLEVDNGHARRVLDWSPPVPLTQGIASMAHAFLDSM